MNKKSLLGLSVSMAFVLSACSYVNDKEILESTSGDEYDYDIYEKTDSLEEAAQKEQDIIEQWNADSYSFEEPLTIQNPYDISPLTAVSLFETEEPAEITVTVAGYQPETTITHTYEGFNTVHEVSILGLYPDEENSVTLTAEYEDGSTDENTFNLETEPLPEDFYTIDVNASQAEKMADGLTYLISSSSELFAVDAQGEVRFYLTPWIHNNFEMLENGNMVMTLRDSEQNWWPFGGAYNHIVELNHLGKPFNSYWFDQDNYNGTKSLHHDMIELENGNLLVLAYDGSGEYIEDEMFEMDLETGEVIRNFNFKDIFPAAFYEEYEGPSADEGDWFHQNAVWQTRDEDHVLVSSRNQDMILKMSYPEGDIDWILAADENWPENARPDETLLEPLGDVKFPMAQHAPYELPDFDNDPTTMDIILFDNNYYATRGHADLHGDYSRAVHYRIDEKNMTVEEIWSYGEERGEDYYSWIVGNALYLPETDTVLLNSGRVYNAEEYPTSYITEVTHDEEKEVVFEVELTEFDYDYSDRSQIYRAERHPLYTNGSLMDLDLE